MKRPHPALATFSLLLAGCLSTNPEEGQQDAGTNSETKTTFQARFYLPDGSPAAHAEATWLPYCQGCATRSIVTDGQGNLADTGIPAGVYGLKLTHASGNILFQDSVLSDGQQTTSNSDTLRHPAVVEGRIVLRREDSTRPSMARILGVELRAFTAPDGRFQIEGVPAGRYTIEGTNTKAGYLPTFKTFRIQSADTLDLGDIELLSTRPPELPRFHSDHDTLGGTVELTWEPVADSRIASVLLAFTCRDSRYEGNIWTEKTKAMVPIHLGRRSDTVRGTLERSQPIVDWCFWKVTLVDSAGSAVSSGSTDTLRLPTPAAAFELAPTWTRLADLPPGRQELVSWGGRLVNTDGGMGRPLVLQGGRWGFLFADTGMRVLAAHGDSAWTWLRDGSGSDSGSLELRTTAGDPRTWRLAVPESTVQIRVANLDGVPWVGFFGRLSGHPMSYWNTFPDSLLQACRIEGGSCLPASQEPWRFGKTFEGENIFERRGRAEVHSDGSSWLLDWCISSEILPNQVHVRRGDSSWTTKLASNFGFRGYAAWDGQIWLVTTYVMARSMKGAPERIGSIRAPLEGQQIYSAVLEPNRIVVGFSDGLYSFDPAAQEGRP